jgi:uncharacterized repeat protein (TIGR03837 family)
LLEAIAGGTLPTVVFVPESSALAAVGDQLGGGHIMVGDIVSKGNLTLHALPFLTQDDYDRLLWACDINFVRGEDSWVRGLWAGKPMIWQPYRQVEDAHLIKLQAFLNLYADGLPQDCSELLQQLHVNWSNGDFAESGWQSLLMQIELWRDHAQKQAAARASQPDLAAKLVIFCENFSK